MLTVNIKFNYRKLRRSLIFYLISIGIIEAILMNVAFAVQRIFETHFNIQSYILMFWSVHTLSMFLSQMILLIVTIRQRFEALNYVLQTRSCFKPQQLRVVSKIHLRLTEIIDMMNQSYCLMAMFFFAGAFCLFNLFLFSLKFMIAHFTMEFFTIFMSRVLLNCYSMLLTMAIIVVASQATKEARRTVRVLFELLHQTDDDIEWSALSQNFVQQITFSQTKFTCGLFTYDWPLCFKVINFYLFWSTCGLLLFLLLSVYKCQHHVSGDSHSVWDHNARWAADDARCFQRHWIDDIIASLNLNLRLKCKCQALQEMWGKFHCSRAVWTTQLCNKRFH